MFWLSMDKDIEKTVKNCRSCVLAAKLLSIKPNMWPKIDIPWVILFDSGR